MRKFDLQILLDLVDKFSGPLQRGPMKQLAALQRQTEVVDRSMDNVFLGGAIAGGAAAFAAPLVIGTQRAIEFEAAMADVKRVVDFATPRAFKDMSADILQLSLRIPLAGAELAQIMEAAGQAKIARGELLRFTQDAGKMGTAFKIPAAEAGAAMTGFRTIFRLTQDEVVLLGDAFNYLGNNMDARASDIVNIANRTGATAKLFGLTGQQAGALGASFLALKAPPEVAATGINALLNRLATAPQQTEAFQGGLAKIGLEATDLKRRIGVDAQGALLDFLQRVRGSGDVLGVLTDLFGAEYADDIAKLVNSLGVYENALGLVGDQTRYAGSMQREFLGQSATTKNALVLLRNNFNALGITLGSFFLPVIQLAARLMGGLIGPIVRLIDANPALARVLAFVTAALLLLTIGVGLGIVTLAGFTLATTQARIGLVGLAAWFRATRAAMTLFVTGGVPTAATAGLLTGRFTTLNLMLEYTRMRFMQAATAARVFALSLLTNPVFLVIAAVVALGAAFVWAWRRSEDFRAGVMKGLEPITRSWAALKNDVAALGNTLAPVGAFFGRILSRMGIDVSNLKRPIDALRYGFGFFVGFVGTAAATIIGRVIASWTVSFGGLVQIVDGLVTAAQGLATLDFQKMLEGLGEARGGLEQILLSPLELAGIDSKRFRKDMGGIEGLTDSWQARIGRTLGVPASLPAPDTQPFALGLNSAMWIAESWGIATRAWVGERFQTGKIRGQTFLDSLRLGRDDGAAIWGRVRGWVGERFELPEVRPGSFLASLRTGRRDGQSIWRELKDWIKLPFSLPWVSSNDNLKPSLRQAETDGRGIWGRVRSFFTARVSVPGLDLAALETSLQSMLDTILAFGPQMLEAGRSLIGGLIDGFNERVGELTSFLDRLKFPWQRGKEAGGAPTPGTPTAPATYAPPVANRPATPGAMRPLVPQVAFDLNETLRLGNVDPMSRYGQLLAQGLARGILSEQDVAVYAVQRMGAEAEAALRNRLQIRSPSRVFEGLGAFIPQGLGQGILGQRSAVVSAMRLLAAAAVAVPVAPDLGEPRLPDRPSLPRLPALERSTERRQTTARDGATATPSGGPTIHKTYSFAGANFTLDMSEIRGREDFMNSLDRLFEMFGDDS